jgi:Na+-transporting NADH:ubiquinone oxidoreductase subunit NqrF
MQLRFGRFQGYEVADVEDERYLVWLSGQPWLWPALRAEIHGELSRRQCERNLEAWEGARRERRRAAAARGGATPQSQSGFVLEGKTRTSS